jgi:hypothetical protein
MQCFISRIEFLVIPAVALALLINHEFTVLEVRSRWTCSCDRKILAKDRGCTLVTDFVAMRNFLVMILWGHLCHSWNRAVGNEIFLEIFGYMCVWMLLSRSYLEVYWVHVPYSTPSFMVSGLSLTSDKSFMWTMTLFLPFQQYKLQLIWRLYENLCIQLWQDQSVDPLCKNQLPFIG